MKKILLRTICAAIVAVSYGCEKETIKNNACQSEQADFISADEAISIVQNYYRAYTDKEPGKYVYDVGDRDDSWYIWIYEDNPESDFAFTVNHFSVNKLSGAIYDEVLCSQVTDAEGNYAEYK